LRQLFIGSEGTLGFITEVTVGVTRQPQDLAVFVLGAPELSAIMEIYKLFKSRFNLTAYEMFTDVALKYTTALGRAGKPFDTDVPYYVLIEIEKENEGVLDAAMATFEECVEKGFVVDGTVSQNPKQAADFWSLREDITE